MSINTYFLPNVVLARSIGLAQPCFGATIALRSETLDEIGGFHAFADCLADDYAVGEAVREAGYDVAIPPFSVGHVCFEQTAAELLRHQMRQSRTIRSIDPVGYAGAIITHPFALALLGTLLGSPVGLLVAALAVVCRTALTLAVERAFGLTTSSILARPVPRPHGLHHICVRFLRHQRELARQPLSRAVRRHGRAEIQLRLPCGHCSCKRRPMTVSTAAPARATRRAARSSRSGIRPGSPRPPRWCRARS